MVGTQFKYQTVALKELESSGTRRSIEFHECLARYKSEFSIHSLWPNRQPDDRPPHPRPRISKALPLLEALSCSGDKRLVLENESETPLRHQNIPISGPILAVGTSSTAPFDAWRWPRPRSRIHPTALEALPQKNATNKFLGKAGWKARLATNDYALVNQMITVSEIPNEKWEPAQIIEAAEKGGAWAQNWMGVQYLHGKGVPKDPVIGEAWIRKAALQGNQSAQSNLGGCYHDGLGVGQNLAEAESWYQKAADQGQEIAQTSLGFLFDEKKDFKNALYWYRRAAKQGEGFAQNNLAILYHAGSGVPVNSIEAYKWYSLAAAQNVDNSIEALPELTKEMTGAQIAEGQRRAAEFVPREERVSQSEEPTAIDKLIMRCGGEFTRLIERLEAFEDRLKVRLEALKVDIGKSTAGYDAVWVSGELHPNDGVEIGEDVQLIVDILDDKGRVVNMGSYVFLREKFFGFESFMVMIAASSDDVSKIRVYPKKC